MTSNVRRALGATAAAIALLPAAASANIDIVFDYTYDTGGFFGATQKNILEAAAGVFESRIEDALGAITSGATGSLNVAVFNPSNYLGANLSFTSFSVAANELTVFVGADSLGGSTLGIGGPGGFGASGTSAFLDSLGRDQTGYLDAGNDTDFGPWGGAISFNKDANWYFDTDVSSVESFSGNDFYSVAMHELSHLLGFGTAESWDVQVSGTTFSGSNSGVVALSGDAHWLDGTMSTIDGSGSFETLMDPTITTGTRKFMTDLDWNGLRDVGWQVAVTAVPEPTPTVMLLAGLAGLGLIARRRRR
jgi:MYXO-CTERM domain-containing protein